MGLGVTLVTPGLWWSLPGQLLGANFKGTLVSDVSVLRLNFQTDGVVYNLGVVDNKQTGQQAPIGGEEAPVSDFWIYALAVIVVLILVNVAFAFLNKFIGRKAMVILSSFSVLAIVVILRICASVYLDKFAWLSSWILPLNITCWVLVGVFALVLFISLVQALRGNGKK